MTRNLFGDGTGIPGNEEVESSDKEYTPPEEEFNLAEVIKPVEYYENRFYQVINYRTVLLDGLRIRKLEDRIAEYEGEVEHIVETLNYISGEERDFSSELTDLLEKYRNMIWSGIKLDRNFCLGISASGMGAALLCPYPFPINLGAWIGGSILSFFAIYQGTSHYGPLLKPLVNNDIKPFTLFADLREYYSTALEECKGNEKK